MPMHPDARRLVMNAIFTSASLTIPTTFYLYIHGTTLSTAASSTSGGLPTTLNAFSSVSDTNYAPKPLITSGASAIFTSATTLLSTVHLTTRVQFGDPITNWTTAKGWSLWDSSNMTGATGWFFGDADTPVSITAGNPIAISSGASTNGLRIGLS